MRKLRKLDGVKKVFVRSGLRFDYIMADSDDTFLKELCEYHISGQLRVAPEHISDEVLRNMGKPENAVYEAFKRRYDRINKKVGKKQFVVPYLMSSHPGSTLKEAVELAVHLRDLGYMPEQVQDFYPDTVDQYQLVCIIQVLTQEQEKVYTPVNLTKRLCRGHLYSIKILRIMIL